MATSLRRTSKTPLRAREYTLTVRRGEQVEELPVLVCRNTRVGERPWRVNVFNSRATELALPHLTLSLFPRSGAEVLFHLQAVQNLHSLLRNAELRLRTKPLASLTARAAAQPQFP